MALRPAWAAEGSRIPASVMRNLAWNATNGATGVTKPNDLKVTALAVPGAAVNIRTGGWCVESTYALAAGAPESYTGGNDATFQLAVPGGLATETTYIVILRIDDPEMSGGAYPADPLTYNYCRFDLVTQAALSGVTDPFLQLAKIVLPASTATVTSSMITDLRQVANLRQWPFTRVNALTAGESETLAATGADGEFFPNAGGYQKFDIPKDATRVSIDVRFAGLLMDSAASTGRLWVGWGDKATPTRYENNTQETSYAGETNTSRSRGMAEVADYMVVPEEYRGRTDVTFATMGRKISGVGATMDSLTNIVWNVVFLADSDPSTT